jgi:hypothetical protein
MLCIHISLQDGKRLSRTRSHYARTETDSPRRVPASGGQRSGTLAAAVGASQVLLCEDIHTDQCLFLSGMEGRACNCGDPGVKAKVKVIYVVMVRRCCHSCRRRKCPLCR